MNTRKTWNTDFIIICHNFFKANFLFFWRLCALGFLSRKYWSWLDHDRMASFWEKAISILTGNLNSVHSYPITTVRNKDGVISEGIFNFNLSSKIEPNNCSSTFYIRLKCVLFFSLMKYLGKLLREVCMPKSDYLGWKFDSMYSCSAL